MELQVFTREGRNIAAYKKGSGKTIVALNGFGCTHAIYQELAEALSEKYQVVIIENRGLGKSSSTTTPYTIKDLALDAKFVIDSMKLDEIGIMGISMGGFIAQELALLTKDKLKALALMCTTSVGEGFIHPTALTEAGLRQFATLDPAMAAEFSVVGTTHPSLRVKNPTQFKKIVDYRIKHRAETEELIRQNEAAVNFLKTPIDLSTILCPVLAMCGENDRFVNPQNVDNFARVFKTCQTKKIPESDHFFFMEKPEAVAEALNRFFIEVL